MTALLREGLRELGLDESRAETLERFAALLLKKNEVMNLTAITEPEAVAQLHLLDSAALTQFVDLSGKTVVDVGTGAGFPGMPLRILKDDFDLTAQTYGRTWRSSSASPPFQTTGTILCSRASAT